MIIASNVPLVSDSTPDKVKPSIKQKSARNCSKKLEFSQLTKQKIVTPNSAVENGMGLPENNCNRPFMYSEKPNCSLNHWKAEYITKMPVLQKP